MIKRLEILGNIASGKTTLCKNMGKKGYLSIFENFQDNPFFENFYKDPQAYSFETELTFLLQHYHSIKIPIKKKMIACDYSLFLDMAYADVNLTGNRHKLFTEIVEELLIEIGHPLQIIHLTCPEEILLQRIAARNRDVEKSISVEYLKALSKAISSRLKKIPDQIKVIPINSNSINFVSGIEGIKEFESISNSSIINIDK